MKVNDQKQLKLFVLAWIGVLLYKLSYVAELAIFLVDFRSKTFLLFLYFYREKDLFFVFQLANLKICIYFGFFGLNTFKTSFRPRPSSKQKKQRITEAIYKNSNAKSKVFNQFFCYSIFFFSVWMLQMNGKWSGNQQTFQNRKGSMQGQIKMQYSFNPLEEQVEDGRNIGCWSIQQNLLYSIFIDQNKMTMISKKKRKKSRIFDKMAEFISTRNSLQCRSHHQKLIEKLGEIKAIIVAFKKYFGKQYYREQYNIYTGRNSKRNSIESTKTIKSEENVILEYFPLPNNQPQSQQPDSSHQKQPSLKQKDVPLVPQPQKVETIFPQCKAQSIDYYYPYNYYVANNILQFPFFNPFFPPPQALNQPS